MKAAVVLCVVVTACSPLATVCPDDLRMLRQPADTTITVGSEFVPKVELRGCAGSKHLDDPLVFSAQHPTVLSVESSTGRTTALAVGESWVNVTGTRYHFPGRILVTVVE